jgi:ABC-2 type transport system permease protein
VRPPPNRLAARPHIRIPVLASERTFHEVVRPAVRDAIEPYLRDHPSTVMVPVGFLVLGTSWPATAWPGLLLVLTLGAAAGAGLGMALGTIVGPERISVAFALVFAPLTFTGSVQYSWAALADLRWFQVVSALNPLTYASEGMRAVTLPQVQSIPLWIDLLVLCGVVVLFVAVGIRGFMARARG